MVIRTAEGYAPVKILNGNSTKQMRLAQKYAKQRTLKHNVRHYARRLNISMEDDNNAED